MNSSYFSRRWVSVVTMVAMLASQFGPIWLNMAFAAAGTLVALQTTANVSAVSEVKASRTLTVAVLPAALEIITIGSCVVTFVTIPVATTDDTNCADNIATIDRDLGLTDTPRTPIEIADVLDSLTNVSDPTHGSLIVAADTSTTTVFTTAGTESLATVITLLPSANITATTTVTGVIPVAAVAQVVTFTVAGSSSIDQDLFRATVNGTDYNYTVNNLDTDTAVASALATAIDANTSVVCTSILNIVTCTATPAGTALTGFAATRLQASSVMTALTASKSVAAGLITANAVESTTPGQHVVGSLATLVLAQTAANATTASAQSVVDGQVTTLNSAISAYNAAIVGPSVMTALTALKAIASGLITASGAEGTVPGNHTPGALLALTAAQTAANATAASPQLTVDTQVITLSWAISAYNLAIVAPSNVTVLTTSKATAAGLITANAPESTTPGQHVVGSLAILSAAQTAANATSASPQLTVDTQVTTLDAAISAYNLAIVGPSDISALITAKSSAGFLITASGAEGTVPGNHTPGALLALTAAQTAANATSASPQLTVNGQVTVLNSAILAYIVAIVAPSNLTVLTASKATAAGLITANAPESTTPTQHVVGSLATLVLAQAVASATSASAQSVVDGQVTTLNSAISAYNAAIVGPSVMTALTTAKNSVGLLITASGAESTTIPGNHTPGSLATLSGVLAATTATSASAQSVVDGQVTTLNTAISTYNAAIVGPDIIAPIVTLSGAATLTLAFGAVYAELGARWVDVVDGSGAATVSGTVNTGIAGVYVLSYKKTDLAGNMSNVVTRTVTVSPAPASSGGGGGSSSSIPPAVVTTATGSTQSGSTATGSTAAQLVVVTPSSNPNIAQDTFVRKSADFKKSKVITTTTTLKKGTTINVFRVLPNGKSIKVGTTKVLPNGEIRFTTKIAGTYKLEQK